MEIRLQKILSQAGYGSRRSCEKLIAEGRVVVNGSQVSLGDKADPDRDTITLDGVQVNPAEELRYYLLHKPKGVLSTVSSEDGRPTVRSLIDQPGRLYPVGRLDLNSEGLILMTNDGLLTYRLTHPSYQHEKEYRVYVYPRPGERQLDAWRKGLILDDGSCTQPAEVWVEHNQESGTWLGVILKEGKKRQLRRMAESTGLSVKRLIRTRISSLQLGDLLPGEWRALTKKEIKRIHTSITGKG
jgi:23S rRNA pseudouridine2605 synthase